MPNLAISEKGSDEIFGFFHNARKKGRRIIGDETGQKKSLLVQRSLYDFKWTNDSVTWEKGPRGKVIFNKTMSQLVACQDCLEVEEIDHAAENIAINRLQQISQYSYSQIDTYVDSTDNKAVLKMYGKVILGLCKVVFKLIK